MGQGGQTAVGTTRPACVGRSKEGPAGCGAGNRSREQDLRLFQSVLEILTLKGLNAAQTTEWPAGDASWWAGLSTISGLPEAMRVRDVPGPPAGDERAFVFHPTPESLEELYLAHRSLRLGARPLGCRDRRALEVLVVIAAELRRNGLRGAYVAAAKRARANLPAVGGKPGFPPA